MPLMRPKICKKLGIRDKCCWTLDSECVDLVRVPVVRVPKTLRGLRPHPNYLLPSPCPTCCQRNHFTTALSSSACAQLAL